jgi:hypothetical protein
MKCKTIIKIQGHLNGKWKECFEGMEITIFTGKLKNEAHMYGVLNIIRDYNLILISINSVKDSIIYNTFFNLRNKNCTQ